MMGDDFHKYLLARKTPDILPRTPKRIKKKQHHLPAVMFAHRVMAMTPLFWLNNGKSVSMDIHITSQLYDAHLGEDRQGGNGKQSRKETSDAVALFVM